jgi:AraC-like DNA-binding protein
VSASDPHTVYRVCLREVPPALADLRAGAASIDVEAAGLLRAIGRPGVDERFALDARARVMSGLAVRAAVGRRRSGSGFAGTVASALSHGPGDPTTLAGWAERLHISAKTLQRDFEREFGMSYTRWRADLRLRAARALLHTQPVGEVARRVGYATPSAFVAAFRREFGHPPARFMARAGTPAPHHVGERAVARAAPQGSHSRPGAPAAVTPSPFSAYR